MCPKKDIPPKKVQKRTQKSAEKVQIAKKTQITSDLEVMEQQIAPLSRNLRSAGDTLKAYFQEIQHYPLLTPEEEIALFRQMHENGDLEAAKRLVQSNLRLVIKIAYEYRSIYANLGDLIQEGNLGLMKAVSKFDPSKGARLSYYSSWWIRSYILKYLLDNFRLVKIGTTQTQKRLFYNLLREKEKIESQGMLAGPKLLADRLHVREKDIVEMEARLFGSGREVPFDAPANSQSDSKATLSDVLPSIEESPDEALSHQEQLKILNDRMPKFRESLNDRERLILDSRLLAEEPQTLQEIADKYGLTRERARQIEAGILQKLKQFLGVQPNFS